MTWQDYCYLAALDALGEAWRLGSSPLKWEQKLAWSLYTHTLGAFI